MKVTLLDYMENAEKIMVAAAYATRSPRSAVDIDPTDKMIRDMVKWTKKYKLSSVLDFPYYIFTIEGVSRVFTHQWVRYRHAAHMQQSQRYVKVKVNSADWFVIPPSIVQKGADVVIDYIRAHLEMGKRYKELLKRGIMPEDARFLLPNSVKTHISTAFDAEEMIHIIYQRTCFDAQWEIRTVAYAILFAGLLVHPIIFDGVGPPCIYEGVCRSPKKGVCEPDAKGIITQLVRRKDAVKDKFEKLERGEFLKVDLTDILGYRAPRDVVREVNDKLGFDVNLDFEVLVWVKKK